MLLRRIIEHVRAQNWTAVGLDFVIVVVGVFIGIQVSNWNAQRQARTEEIDALNRLQLEAEQVVSFWNYQVVMWRQQNVNRRILLEVLDAGTMTTAQEEAVDDAIMRLGHYPHFNPPRTVYDELIGAGGLSRISDMGARNAVSEYVAEVEYVNGQLTQFRTNLPELYKAYQGRIFSTFAPEENSLRRFEYDIESLSQDRAFISKIVDAVRNQLQFQTYREGALRKAILMCEAVSQAVSKPCAPSELSLEEILSRDGVNQ